MVRIEELGVEYTTGAYKIVLEKNETRKDDIEFELQVLESQKLRLMSVERTLSNEKIRPDDIDTALSRQSTIMKDILRTSYPGKDSKWYETVNMNYGQELLLELYFIWGFRNKEAFNAAKEAQKKIIEKVKNGEIDDLYGNNKSD